MGCQASSLVYSVPINTEFSVKGESQTYRSPGSRVELLSVIPEAPDVKTCQDVFLHAVNKYGSKPFVGTREVLPGGALGRFKYKSYNQLRDITKLIGSGIINLDLAPTVNEFQDLKLNFIAIYSKNREEFLTLDLACSLYGLTSIPIYDTLGPEAVDFIFEQTKLTTIFCSGNFIGSLTKDTAAGKTARLKNLVSFDAFTEEQSQKAKEAGLTLYNWADVLKAGESNPQDFVKITPDTIYTFSYTSGTTGTPKAAMLSHGNIVSVVASVTVLDVNINSKDIHLSYLPMAHVMERLFVNVLLYYGCAIGFYSGDTQKIKDDLQELKPTLFLSVPRLFNRFHDLMKDGINKLTGIKKTLADKAIATKLKNLKSYGQYTHSVYDALVFNKTKMAVGGSVRIMVTGSAPISVQVIDFLKIAICCPVLEAYGQTESSAASFATRIIDGQSGHVGGPLRCLEFKVVDVPEMNYTSKDKDSQGEPLPRGEICMRGPSIFKGYYKQLEKTAEAIDQDGWLHSGDIGQIHQNGSLKIIDRKKNIFKLAIGEYIASEKIENIYMRHKYVAEVFLYGDSLQHYLIAVIVPHKHEILKLGEALKIEGSFEELCKNKQIVDKVLKDINELGKAEKLLSFELAKKLVLEPVSFVTQNLMTPSFKLMRHDAKKVYQKDIDFLYSTPLEEGGPKK